MMFLFMNSISLNLTLYTHFNKFNNFSNFIKRICIYYTITNYTGVDYMMIGVKSLSFTDEYKEEYLHFLKQFNRSRYVCELIREDMKRAKHAKNDTNNDRL